MKTFSNSMINVVNKYSSPSLMSKTEQTMYKKYVSELDGLILNNTIKESDSDKLDGLTTQKMNYSLNLISKAERIPSNINNSDAFPKYFENALGETSSSTGYIKHDFEDDIHFTTATILDANKYRFIYKRTLRDIISKGIDGEVLNEKGELVNGKENSTVLGAAQNTIAVPSLFNPKYAVNILGSVKSVGLYNKNTLTSVKAEAETADSNAANMGDSNLIKDKTPEYTITFDNTMGTQDFTDCSIRTLVKLSKANSSDKKSGARSCPMGYERFDWKDFMFCKDLGKIPNNYLITLRRFPIPIGDNITDNVDWRKPTPDEGRMITWLGEDNKLEDILKYNYSMSWKELNSKIEEKQSEEDNMEARGLIGSAVNLTNPSYLKSVASGYAGSGNKILGKMTQTKLGTIMSNNGTYEGHACLGNYDQNRVYEPKDTVQDTHLYEGKLKFSQEFTLVFNYELRAYQNINPRAAFADLIGNIHYTTYRAGKFWGGAHKIVGAPGNPGGWKKANAFIDQKWDELGGFVEGLLTGNLDWSSIWGSISNAFGEAAKTVSDIAGEAQQVVKGEGMKPGGKIEKAVQKFKSSGMGDAFKGMLKNKLGRPAMYAFNSLLSGEPVGVWHLTIGNPRAPILSMGNLILTNSSIQHYGPLGIDDFPTGLKVTVQLKHGRSRDAIEIQHMYTGGKDVLVRPAINIGKIEDYYQINGMEASIVDIETEAGTKSDGTPNIITTKTTKYKANANAAAEDPAIISGAAGDAMFNALGTDEANESVVVLNDGNVTNK